MPGTGRRPGPAGHGSAPGRRPRAALPTGLSAAAAGPVRLGLGPPPTRLLPAGLGPASAAAPTAGAGCHDRESRVTPTQSLRLTVAVLAVTWRPGADCRCTTEAGLGPSASGTRRGAASETHCGRAGYPSLGGAAAAAACQ